jgi:hypothetical protein
LLHHTPTIQVKLSHRYVNRNRQQLQFTFTTPIASRTLIFTTTPTDILNQLLQTVLSRTLLRIYN